MLNLTLLLAALIGAAFAMQPAINAIAGQAFGAALPAAALSLGISFVAASVLSVALGQVPNLAQIQSVPWWVVFGGLIGVMVVAGGAAIVPITGTALFFVCLIAGQLTGSLLLDHFGGYGMAVREISPQRLIGALLAFGGVLLVRFG